MFQDEKGRRVIRLGDTTSHGGKVITGAEMWNVYGKPVARVGDQVICHRCDNKVYEIVEGNQKITAFGRPVAFEGHKTSCGAILISSLGINEMARQMETMMQSSLNNTPSVMSGTLTADASGRNYAQRRSNDVPVHRSPIFRASEEGDEVLKIMINNNGEGHVGFMIGEGDGSMLFDPSGSYSGCYERACFNGDPSHRGSSDTLEYPYFDWDDYLIYQRSDGSEVNVYLFVIPRDQAEIIRASIKDSEYQGFVMCATSTSSVLKGSGGVFSQLSDPWLLRTPWGLESEIKDILYPGRGGFIRSAY